MAMKFLARLLFVIAVIMCGYVPADAIERTQPDVEINVATVAALQAGHFNAPASISLAGYLSSGDGGGGELVLNNSCTVNNGTCFQTAAGTKYSRKTPKWDVAEWGIFGDGTTSQSTQFNAMLAAAATAGIHTVTVRTSGQFILDNGLSIPQFMTVQCFQSRSDIMQSSGGTISGDHKNIPYLMVVASGKTITMASSSSLMRGCNVEYKPVWDTPNPTSSSCCWTDLQTTVAAFGGVGVTVSGDGSGFADGMILGFTTGFSSTTDTIQVHNVFVDSTNCYHVKNGQGLRGGELGNFQCKSILTSGLSFAQIHLPISAAADDGGVYEVTLASACTTVGNCPTTGQTVYFAQPIDGNNPVGVESLWGACTWNSIDTSHGTCTNSQSTATVTTGTTITGSCKVTGVGTMTYVRALQQVSGTNIPGSATVVAAWPQQSTIWFTSPTGCATGSGAIANLTFTDNAYVATDPAVLELWSNNRNGIGLEVENTHLFTFVSCEVYTHATAFKFDGGSSEDSFTGCGAEAENDLLDNTYVGMDYESASSISFVGGSVDIGSSNNGGNNGFALVYNAGTNTAENEIVGTNFGGGADVETGRLNFKGNFGQSTVNIFVADAIKTFNLVAPINALSTVYFQSPTAASNTCTLAPKFIPSGGGSPVALQCPSTVTNAVTAHVGGGQASATALTTIFNRVNSVGSDHDSVALPPAIAGSIVYVVNSNTSHILDVYGNYWLQDTINSQASGTAFSIPPKQSGGNQDVIAFISTGNGNWMAFLPATFALTGSASDITAGTLSDSRLANSGVSPINGVNCTLGSACTVGFGPTYSVSGSLQTPGHSVMGTFTLSTGAVTITLTGSAVFTNSGSYACYANDNGGSAVVASTKNTSGSVFTIAGTGSDTGTYICFGN